MASKYSVSLKKIIDVHSFSVLYTPCDTAEIMITMQEVIRPGLILSGYDDAVSKVRAEREEAENAARQLYEERKLDIERKKAERKMKKR